MKSPRLLAHLATRCETDDEAASGHDGICDDVTAAIEARDAEWLDRLRGASRLRDDDRRRLGNEFELRTRALQAMNDRLLGLLSGKIALEPSPPIIVNRECKKCGEVFGLPPGLTASRTPDTRRPSK